MTPAYLCEHANEVPRVCRCPAGCYCKSHTCDWHEEPTSPGTPVAKRTQSAELAAVRAENTLLRDRLASVERRASFLERRHDALIGRVQALENASR